MKIVFPELTKNEIAKEAISHFEKIEWLPANSLDEAAEMVKNGQADSMISGLDYSSRDVVITYKNHISLKSNFFSSCFVLKRPDGYHLTLADGGINKLPTEDQLYTIVEDTANTHQTYFNEQPKIAMLSYSTYGSGGKNPDLEKIHNVIIKIREKHPDWLIDGEMQLDAAISKEVAAKKTPNSPLQGEANILITPDLNSGNILYKSLERFGGFTAAGPIVQGFMKPLADLSRGSTVEDTISTIDVITKLLERN
ncbi:phosphate acetyltransferase [Candidatus Saccharibacteria bacterium]|nr:phosphate acetyltransferase [Candidatus Saccharibacteria bacterium]